jgi:hypothetical protein
MIDEDEDTTAEADEAATDEADDAPAAEADDGAIDVAEAAGDDDAVEIDMAPVDTAEPGDPGVPSPEELMDDPGPPITGMKADAQEHVDEALGEDD